MNGARALDLSRRIRVRLLCVLVAAAGVAMPSLAAMDESSSTAVALDVHDFHPVEGPSTGPAVYYRVVDEPDRPVLRGTYEPGLQSVTMGIQVPQRLGRGVQRVRWMWRARTVPELGDECRPDHGDSAASVSLAFRRGGRWYILKYVWSGASPAGAVCERTRSLFLSRDTIVLEHGGARDTWLREVVDVRRAFIDHFADGDLQADVPALVGIGVMTDGDQTSSRSGADWTAFELEYGSPR